MEKTTIKIDNEFYEKWMRDVLEKYGVNHEYNRETGILCADEPADKLDWHRRKALCAKELEERWKDAPCPVAVLTIEEMDDPETCEKIVREARGDWKGTMMFGLCEEDQEKDKARREKNNKKNAT